jgi:hypothetical protein
VYSFLLWLSFLLCLLHLLSGAHCSIDLWLVVSSLQTPWLGLFWMPSWLFVLLVLAILGRMSLMAWVSYLLLPLPAHLALNFLLLVYTLRWIPGTFAQVPLLWPSIWLVLVLMPYIPFQLV